MSRKSKIAKDNKRLQEMEKRIRAGVNYSLAILGMQFVWHGSGKFLNIRSSPSKSHR